MDINKRKALFTGEIITYALTVRTQPDIKSEVIIQAVQLARSNTVDVLEKVTGTDGEPWYLIRSLTGVSGYVHASSIKPARK